MLASVVSKVRFAWEPHRLLVPQRRPDTGSFVCPACNQRRHPRVQINAAAERRQSGASGDANADANWESEPVGCCRSDGPERIQETAPDGASQAPYAFWKCGWWGDPPLGFDSRSLRFCAARRPGDGRDRLAWLPLPSTTERVCDQPRRSSPCCSLPITIDTVSATTTPVVSPAP